MGIFNIIKSIFTGNEKCEDGFSGIKIEKQDSSNNVIAKLNYSKLSDFNYTNRKTIKGEDFVVVDENGNKLNNDQILAQIFSNKKKIPTGRKRKPTEIIGSCIYDNSQFYFFALIKDSEDWIPYRLDKIFYSNESHEFYLHGINYKSNRKKILNSLDVLEISVFKNSKCVLFNDLLKVLLGNNSIALKQHINKYGDYSKRRMEVLNFKDSNISFYYCSYGIPNLNMPYYEIEKTNDAKIISIFCLDDQYFIHINQMLGYIEDGSNICYGSNNPFMTFKKPKHLIISIKKIYKIKISNIEKEYLLGTDLIAYLKSNSTYQTAQS
jgi:hypothetical protein